MENNHRQAVECDTCDYHGEFSTLLTTAMADLKWIRWTGYGILCVTGSFLLTIWSVLYPQIMSINEQLQHMRVLTEVNTRDIVSLKITDGEAKDERRELRAQIDQMWKGVK